MDIENVIWLLYLTLPFVFLFCVFVISIIFSARKSASSAASNGNFKFALFAVSLFIIIFVCGAFLLPLVFVVATWFLSPFFGFALALTYVGIFYYILIFQLSLTVLGTIIVGYRAHAFKKQSIALTSELPSKESNFSVALTITTALFLIAVSIFFFYKILPFKVAQQETFEGMLQMVSSSKTEIEANRKIDNQTSTDIRVI